MLRMGVFEPLPIVNHVGYPLFLHKVHTMHLHVGAVTEGEAYEIVGDPSPTSSSQTPRPSALKT